MKYTWIMLAYPIWHTRRSDYNEKLSDNKFGLQNFRQEDLVVK